MSQIRPVGIADFSLITALGSDKQTQRQQVLAGSLSGMLTDTTFLRGRETVVGCIQGDLPAMPEALKSFNLRACQLLIKVLDEVSQTLEVLKTTYPSKRIGVVAATSTSGVDSLAHALPLKDRQGKWPESYHVHHHRMGAVSDFVARYTCVSGPAMTVSTACSSGNKAIASAKRWLNADLCDVVICAGVDVLTELTIRGFDALGALSDTNSIPFSHHRKGINIGEAAAVFVLTQQTHTFNVLSCGESSDAHHISAPDPEGIGAASAMQQALDVAQVNAQSIDYINLHGTGTPQNDIMEAKAIHRVFTDYAHAVPCSSSKPQIGHTLGVSGLAELGLTLLSMSADTGCLPHVYDGAYDREILPLNLVKLGGEIASPNRILSNSFAFGGSNASVVVGQAG